MVSAVASHSRVPGFNPRLGRYFFLSFLDRRYVEMTMFIYYVVFAFVFKLKLKEICNLFENNTVEKKLLVDFILCLIGI